MGVARMIEQLLLNIAMFVPLGFLGAGLFSEVPQVACLSDLAYGVFFDD